MSEQTPLALDFGEARKKFREIAEARAHARRDHERHALASADAEHLYRKELAAAFAIYRAEGKGVQEAEILARGDVADHERERNREHALAKSAIHRLEQLEADRAGWNKLTDWSMRLSPTGQLEEVA